MKGKLDSFALLISILMHASFDAEELHMLYKSLHNMPIPSSTVNADAQFEKREMQTIFSKRQKVISNKNTKLKGWHCH